MSDYYQAVLRNVRISPRKARLVADMIRDRPAGQAVELLTLTHKKASRLILKLVNSAIANATNRATVDIDRLVVGEIFVDGGATWKRWIPRAQGRATPIRKRTSHITVRLIEL